MANQILALSELDVRTKQYSVSYIHNAVVTRKETKMNSSLLLMKQFLQLLLVSF